jgi:hypothetical protein
VPNGRQKRVFVCYIARSLSKACFFPVVCAPHAHTRGLARARAVFSFLSPKKTLHVSGMSCICGTIFGNKCRKPLLLSVDALNLTRYVWKTLTYDEKPITYMVLSTRIMFVRYVSGQTYTYLRLFPDMCLPHVTCACSTRHIS